MDRPLVIGTRPGILAQAQAELVVQAIKQRWPLTECQICTITTSGDIDQRTALWALRARPDQQGFFTSQLERALAAGQIDCAVHSLKDLPTRQADGLVIAAILDRLYPEDCLVCNLAIAGLEDLPAGSRIGTSSLRRAVQATSIRPDLQVVPLRGNVQTRLAKLDAGLTDAILLARAGLERIGLAKRIAAILEPRHFIPAPGQGALAVQVRAADKEVLELTSALDQPEVRVLVEAERQVLVATGCGCHAPLGAFAEVVSGQVRIHGFMADPQGTRVIRSQIAGMLEDASSLASQLADRLVEGLA